MFSKKTKAYGWKVQICCIPEVLEALIFINIWPAYNSDELNWMQRIYQHWNFLQIIFLVFAKSLLLNNPCLYGYYCINDHTQRKWYFAFVHVGALFNNDFMLPQFSWYFVPLRPKRNENIINIKLMFFAQTSLTVLQDVNICTT